MKVTVENRGNVPALLNFKWLLPGERRMMARGVAMAGQALYPALHILGEDSDPPTPQPAPADDLTQLRGIGQRTADDLASLGIATFAALVEADTVYVAERLNGSSERQVAGWQRQARERLGWQ
jgi:hypothetical protein